MDGPGGSSNRNVHAPNWAQTMCHRDWNISCLQVASRDMILSWSLLSKSRFSHEPGFWATVGKDAEGIAEMLK